MAINKNNYIVGFKDYTYHTNYFQGHVWKSGLLRVCVWKRDKILIKYLNDRSSGTENLF